jgi:ACS family D-galactonate transporter-like MFS transporter
VAEQSPPVSPVASTEAGSRRWPWPKRIDIALLSFLALVIAYCDRVNVSAAAPAIMQERHWDTSQMGWVLSGFFIGYTGFMIPAGRLADRYGPKRVFALSIAWWSAFTALTPFPKSLGLLTLVRILMGAGESGTFPSMNAILVRWFPRQEYSRATGFCWSGGYAGPIIGLPLASTMLALFGWRAVFFVFAALGAIWLPLWIWSAEDEPERSAAVSPSELALIRGSRPEVTRGESVPWKRMLKVPPLWALLALHFSSNWFSYVMLSWLPTYLIVVRKFSLSSMAIGAALPYVSALVATNLFAQLIDRLSKTGDRTRVRKLFMIPYALSACALLTVALATTPIMIVLLLCIAMALLTGATPVYSSNSLDIAPRYAGTVVAVQACVANMAGIIAPVVVGYIARSWGWNFAFLLTAIISGLGIIAFLSFGTAEEVID